MRPLQLLRRDGKRLTFLILTISLSIALLTMALLVRNAVTDSIAKYGRQMNGGDLSATTIAGSYDSAALSRIKQLKDVGQIIDFAYLMNERAIVSHKGRSSIVFVRAVSSPSSRLFEGFQISQPQGKSLYNILGTGKKAIGLRQDVANRIGADIGDTVRVHSEATGRSTDVVVGAFVRPLKESAGDISIFGSLYTTYDIAGPLLGFTRNSSNEIFMDLGGKPASKALVETVSQALPPSDVSTVQQTLNLKSDQIEQLAIALVTLCLMALIIGGLSITSTMQLFVEQDRHSIAIMKSVGARASQIIILYLGVAAAIGVVGSLCGALLGTILYVAMSGLAEQFFSIPFEVIVAPWALTLSIGAGSLFSVFFGLLPAWRASRTDPMLILRESEEVRPRLRQKLLLVATIGLVAATSAFITGSPLGLLLMGGLILVGLLVALLARLLFWIVKITSSAFGIWGKLASRNALQDRSIRQVVTILALGVLAIGGTTFLADNMEKSVNRQAKSSFGYDMIVALPIDQDRDIFEEIEDLPGVKYVAKSRTVNIELISINGSSGQTAFEKALKDDKNFNAWFHMVRKFDIQGLDVSQPYFSNPITSGRRLNASDAGKNVITVLDQVASPLGIKVNDVLTVGIDGRRRDFKVVGIEKKGLVVTSLMKAPVEPLLGASASSRFLSVKTYDGEEANVLNAVRKIHPQVSVMPLSDAVKVMTDFLSAQKGLFLLAALVFFLVGSLILVNVLAVAYSRRAKSLAIMKAIGATDGQISLLLRTESLALGISSGVLGAGLAALLSWLAVFGLSGGHGAAGWEVSGWIFAVLIALACLPPLVTSTLLARGIMRSTPLGILRYE